jgi:hypothetical protein
LFDRGSGRVAHGKALDKRKTAAQGSRWTLFAG